jgi:hypothetical protein
MIIFFNVVLLFFNGYICYLMKLLWLLTAGQGGRGVGIQGALALPHLAGAGPAMMRGWWATSFRWHVFRYRTSVRIIDDYCLRSKCSMFWRANLVVQNILHFGTEAIPLMDSFSNM